MDILVNLNLNKNEIQNAVLQPLAVAPSNPKVGQIYYNSVDKTLYVYDGTAWVGGGSVLSVNGKSGVVVLDKTDIGLGNVDNTSDATKKTNFTGSIADNNTGFVTGDEAYDALALKAPLASPVFTGTPTAPTAANGTSTTQIATTEFVQNAFANADAMIFKGTIGTGGTVTTLPATHNAGWTYKVITAGTYAGKTCEVGDLIICIADGTVASDSDWTVAQTNIDGAVTGPSSSVSGHIPTFNGTSGKVIQDGYGVSSTISDDATTIPTTAAVNNAMAQIIKTATGTIGTSATSVSVSYTGTLINMYATISGDVVLTDVNITSSSVTFTVATAPSSAITCTVIYI